MRIDKFLSVAKTVTRKEAGIAARAGKILVNGVVAKNADCHIDPEIDEIIYCGEVIEYRKFIYILMNKPLGVVSATDDKSEKTVLDLLDDNLRQYNLFPCGRLDKYTTGLVLLTNDGELSHKLLSPKHHVTKSYSFFCTNDLTDKDIEKLQKGVHIEGGYLTKPCHMDVNETKTSGVITLTEGKYHQIKQMFGAVGNEITTLKRITFGPLNLNDLPNEGTYRPLTDLEIESLKDFADRCEKSLK